MSTIFQPLLKDTDLFSIFRKYYVTVFGGYLRDYYLGVPPKDIDICVERRYFTDLTKELTSLNYVLNELIKDHYIFSHQDNISIEVMVDDCDFSNTYLSPCATPDVDVNDLYFFYDEGLKDYRMDRWANDFVREFTVVDIIDRLTRKDKVCYSHPEASEDRIEKMKKKGFEVRSGY